MKGAYIIIQGWMLELGLQPTELLVFARIASFAASKRLFTGSIADLSKWACRDERTIRRTLKNLKDNGYIAVLPNKNDKRLCSYGVTKEYYLKLVDKMSDNPYTKCPTNSGQNVQNGGQNVQHIINHNKHIIKEDNKGVRTHEGKEEEYLPNGQKKMTLEEYLAANPLNDVEAFWERQRKRIEATKEEMRKNRRPVKNNPS